MSNSGQLVHSMQVTRVSSQFAPGARRLFVVIGLLISRRIRRPFVRKSVFCTRLCVSVIFMFAVAHAFRKDGEPCPVRNTPSDWRIHVDRSHGFCFSYPPTYSPVAKPWLKKYTNAPDKADLDRLHKAAQEHRLLRLQNNQDTTASIVVFLDGRPFNLQSFVAGAPTGIEDPPERRQFGTETFYYYGPGGGGVEYADEYFFDLKGKTLLIIFDGPYVNDKTPSPETKDLELRLLQTFRTF